MSNIPRTVYVNGVDKADLVFENESVWVVVYEGSGVATNINKNLSNITVLDSPTENEAMLKEQVYNLEVQLSMLKDSMQEAMQERNKLAADWDKLFREKQDLAEELEVAAKQVHDLATENANLINKISQLKNPYNIWQQPHILKDLGNSEELQGVKDIAKFLFDEIRKK